MGCAAMIPRALFPYLALLAVIWVGWLSLNSRATTNTVDSVTSIQDKIYDGISKGISAALPLDQRTKFINVAEKTTLSEDFNTAAIEEVCASRSWPNDVVFQCDKIIGGIGNVRQEVLTCVRWAIEMGAGMIIPNVHPRVDSNSTKGEETANSYQEPASLSTLLDQDLFLERMEEACPQMRIYSNAEVIAQEEGPVQSVGVLGGARGKMEKSRMREVEVTWITAHRAAVGNVSLVTFGRSFADYEICQDGIDFADSFGKLLEFRPDVRRLAAAVLYEISKRFHLELDPKKAINHDGYIGIHLRTSADAMRAGWMSWETQSALYLKYAARYKLPVIYLATGNLSTVDMFSDLIAPTPVVTKFTLLSGAEATLLQSLTWDQQGEVDYLVLEKSAQFLGTADSSFSWGIASARHALSAGGTCGTAARQGRLARRMESDISMDDGLSVIIGADNKLHFKPQYFWP